MNQLPNIAQQGNPVLSNRAKILDFPLESEILQLIDTLITTAIAYQGVGIAAPQISQSYRLFILASHPNQRYPHAPKMEPTAMINPRILNHSKEIIKDWEGCLSVPQIRGLVPRYRTIEAEYATKEGKVKQIILSDFVARIFQHELDHLDGILFTERVEQATDLYPEEEYHQIIGNKHRKLF